MKFDSLTHCRAVPAALCGIAIVTGVAVFRAQADDWDKRTILTVNQPFQVRDKLLNPGKYVFKLLNSSSDRHIVLIYNADENRLVGTIMAIPNYRLQPTGDSRFTFWETPKGSARALRAWFYPGDNFGQEFPYPKHLVTIETASATTTTHSAQSTTQSEVQTPVTPPQQETQTRTEEADRESQPVEIAQNAPPPATPEPAPAPELPATLPKTASPYPLIGLSGLLSLGLYGLLRLKRSA